MERHVQICLHRLSYISIALATLIFLRLFLHTPQTCVDPSDPIPKPHFRFPESTCDPNHQPRTYIPPDKKNQRIRSTKAWATTVSSYTSLFKSFQALNYLSNHSRVLISSAGPGQGVQALDELGIEDVTAVELVESPPLVSRADPHSLPFFDGVFDLGLGVYLDRALFPKRYVKQIERTVRGGGICFVTVEECGAAEVMRITKLFEKSRFVDAKTVVLAGEKRTSIVMRVQS